MASWEWLRLPVRRSFFNLIYEKIFDPELRRNDFEEIRQGLLRDYGKETVLEKMLKRAPDRLLSAVWMN